MNAVAMESANRAYVQQTLNRLKDIATGQAPELPVEEIYPMPKKGSKATEKKKAAGIKGKADKNPKAAEKTSIPQGKKASTELKKTCRGEPS